MFKIKIGEKEYQVENQQLNGKDFSWDLLDNHDGTFHIIKDHKSYKAMLVKKDENGKSMTISVNGNEYEIALQDKYDLLLESLGMSDMASTKLNDIKAPMPGLVLEIKVALGDTIAKGDAVLILEAMKMENMLKSPGEGVIKAIKAIKGEAVEKGQVLIELE